MIQLVTVEQANNALRLNLEADVDDTSRLDDIELKLDQATDIVLDYVKRSDEYWTHETVPGRVSAAIILVLKSLYDDAAAGEMLKGLAGNDLSNPVVGLLYRLRDPACA